MKKIMFMLAFSVVGLFASASSEVKKETSKLVSKLESKKVFKAQAKLFTDVCISFEIWVTDCPDGSIGILAIDAFVVDCESGAQLAGATIYSESMNGACGG